MSFDLTNKNIKDTFQNLLQKTGSEGHLYDLVGNQVDNLTIGGTLTAHSYITSESIVNTSSGSTAFGNSSDDSHTFQGSITASGNISASGDLYSNEIHLADSKKINFVDSNTFINGTTHALNLDGDTFINMYADNYVKIQSGHLWVNSHITASGDISASGDGLFDSVKLNNGDSSNMALDFQGSNPTGLFYDGTNFVWKREGSTALSFAVGNITFGGGGNSKISAVTNTSLTLRGGTTNTVFNTAGINTEGSISSNGAINTLSHITASGDISASGDIFGNTFHSPSSFAKIHSDGVIEARTKFQFGTVSTHGFIDNTSTAGNITIRPGTSSGKIVLQSANQTALTINNTHITASGNISSSGHISASKFVGDGSGLTGLTSAAISAYTNNGNNRVVTSVNGSTVNSEANLTFDGTALNVNGEITSSKVLVNAPNSTDEFFLLKSGSLDSLKVNNQGVLVLGGFTFEPTAIKGGLYYNDDDDEFYAGKNN